VDQDRYSDALPASQQEARLTQQAAISGIDTSYWGPCRMHTDKKRYLEARPYPIQD
jgi:hypothetical protein